MSRLSAAVLAMVFVAVFFAAPLYAAMTICAMPCCHHDDGPKCCTIGTENVASTAARTVVPVAVVVPAETGQTVCLHIPDARIDVPPQPSISAPLHLLNSTFRI